MVSLFLADMDNDVFNTALMRKKKKSQIDFYNEGSTLSKHSGKV